MMSIRKLVQCSVLWAAATFASGCMHAASAGEIALSPSALNADASRYNGQEVIVRGYVTIEPSAHNLYESRSLNKEFRQRWNSGDKSFDPKNYVKYCLTIANPQLLYEHRAEFSGKTMTVKGKFIDDYLNAQSIDLGACPLPTAIIIDEADFKRRYSP